MMSQIRLTGKMQSLPSQTHGVADDAIEPEAVQEGVLKKPAGKMNSAAVS